MFQTLNFQLQVIKWPRCLKLIDFDTKTNHPLQHV